jgi:aminoglycoside phosphotransferase (APT) family kinase protein
VIGVLDWELSTIGNPHADFAYHLMMYRMPPVSVGALLGQDLDALGLPSEDEYVAAYCTRRGLHEVPDLGYYMAFCLFRMAGILHGIRGRVQRGTAVNPQAKRYAAAVETVADLAWKQAESTGLR